MVPYSKSKFLMRGTIGPCLVSGWALRFSHELDNLGRKFKVHTDGSPQLWLTFPMMSLQGQTLGESSRQRFEDFFRDVHVPEEISIIRYLNLDNNYVKCAMTIWRFSSEASGLHSDKFKVQHSST